MSRLDALFHWPGSMGIVLQQFFVVIGFDHQGLHFPQPFDREAGGVPKVGDISERAVACVETVADWLDCVVRH